MKLIEPGIYPDLPDDEYFALPYASKSRLWSLHQKSPAHVYAEMKEGFNKETDALIFGSAFDDYLLTPEGWDSRWGIGPTKSRGTLKWQEALSAYKGSGLLTADEHKKIPDMVESIKNSPLANTLMFQTRGKNQVSLVWDDEVTGVRCKGKVDRYCIHEGRSVHIDVKTARSAAPHGTGNFQYASNDYGYCLQACHYLAGCNALDRLRGQAPLEREFIFVVIGSTPDLQSKGINHHRVKIYRYTQDEAMRLDHTRQHLLSVWKKCQDTDVWPFYPEDQAICDLHIPDYLTEHYGTMQ